MPIYEYRCNACGSEYESFQRITDDTNAPCEACNSGDVGRLVSMSSFHLKGSGWYVTDYKNSAHPGSKPVTTEDGGEKKTETSADPKPAKSETKKKED